MISWSHISLRLLNRLLPHHCPMCDDEMLEQGLCGPCWSQLCFISAPLCTRCGRPLPHHTLHTSHADLSCGACLAPLSKHEKALHKMRAVVRYDEASKAIILPFKHGSRLDLAPLLAKMMVPEFTKMIDEKTVVMPMPLHFTRRAYRCYNQSAELARHLCYQAKCLDQLDVTSLYRCKRTKPLAKHNKKRRAMILKDAFALRKHAQTSLQGRDVLLIDDVLTTGQTASTAAACLRTHGVRHISVLTFARIV